MVTWSKQFCNCNLLYIVYNLCIKTFVYTFNKEFILFERRAKFESRTSSAFIRIAS